VSDVPAGQRVGRRVGYLARDFAGLTPDFPRTIPEMLLLGLGDRQAGTDRGAQRHAQRRHEDRLLLGELLEPAAALLD
jgi:hypothetical protein